MPAIIGKKLGMTQVFTEDGTVVPVTVIEAGPCPVTAIREPERDGYSAVQLAFGDVKEGKLSKAELGHLAKADAGAKRTVVEFRDAELGGDEEPKIGDTVTVESFEPGQQVKVSGVGIGKGFAGRSSATTFTAGRSATAPTTSGRRARSAPAPTPPGCSRARRCRAAWAASASPSSASRWSRSTASETCC